MTNSSSTTRSFCGTRHFASAAEAIAAADNISSHFADPLFRYVVLQVEACPTTDKIHWQYYMQFTKPVRFGSVKTAAPIMIGAKFIVPNGTPAQNVTYCTKEDTRVSGPYFYGEMAVMGPKVTNQTIVDFIAEHPDCEYEDIEAAYPAFCMGHAPKIMDFLARSKRVKFTEPDFVPRIWQEHVLTRLREEPDDRTIFWVTDTVGKQGKSRLSRYLLAEMKAVELGGRDLDMAFIWKNRQGPIALFDISRNEDPFPVYKVAEQLKNGRMISGKYLSSGLQFKVPHVIVFSNKTWDRANWSLDRVVEFNLDGGEWHIPPLPQQAPPEEPILDTQALAEIFQDLPDLPDMPADAFW